METEDILSFTKNITGINLVDYVINYIDQNMILYSILKNTSFSVNANTEDTASVVYDITSVSTEDKDVISSLPEEQTVLIYGKTYSVYIIQDDDRLVIKII